MLERKAAAGHRVHIPAAYNEILSRLETHGEPHLAALESRHYATSVATTRVHLKKSVFVSSASTPLYPTPFLWNWY